MKWDGERVLAVNKVVFVWHSRGRKSHLIWFWAAQTKKSMGKDGGWIEIDGGQRLVRASSYQSNGMESKAKAKAKAGGNPDRIGDWGDWEDGRPPTPPPRRRQQQGRRGGEGRGRWEASWIWRGEEACSLRCWCSPSPRLLGSVPFLALGAPLHIHSSSPTGLLFLLFYYYCWSISFSFIQLWKNFTHFVSDY